MHNPEFTCSVGYDQQASCVVMVLKGYATTPVFRETNERVLACLKDKNASRVLGDIKDFILISAADQDWLNEVWIPRAIGIGLRRVALVLPTYYFNRVAVDTVTSRTDPNRLTVAYFDNAEDARFWLTSEGSNGA
jgi:hypothetical protein